MCLYFTELRQILKDGGNQQQSRNKTSRYLKNRAH